MATKPPTTAADKQDMRHPLLLLLLLASLPTEWIVRDLEIAPWEAWGEA